MKLLIVMLSSFGDILQIFPAITDIQKQHPQAVAHWLVDEQFNEIPNWHPFIQKTHTVPLRKTKKTLFSLKNIQEIIKKKHQLTLENYTHIIDFQSLLKSALLIRHLKKNSYGFDKKSAIEPFASYFYSHKIYTNHPAKNLNLTQRAKQLASKALKYSQNPKTIDYGLSTHKKTKTSQPTILLHPGTTWPTKHWPDKNWLDFIKRCLNENYNIYLSWHGKNELKKYKGYKKKYPKIHLLNKKKSPPIEASSLTDKLETLKTVDCVIAVDTGIAHLANALKTPCIILYGPSPYTYCAAIGEHTIHIKSSIKCTTKCNRKKCSINKETSTCMENINVEEVFKQLKQTLKQHDN
ncbi:MAG: lipopolysaccharide heptosyltransferase I [bacterium]